MPKLKSADDVKSMIVEEKSGLKIGNFVLYETIGTGTFGKVKIGVHKSTGRKVAVKIINRQKIKHMEVVGKIRREIQNLSLFRHPHVIRLYQVISTPSDIFMIMEHVAGGELFDFIVKQGKLKVSTARRFFQQIISGVDYCHRHMVVHRDLKPENLLLDNKMNVKIADFGLSNIMQDGEFLKTSCGSPNYAAPEVISGKLYAGPEIDVWSCGVILYALLSGSLPFDDENCAVLFKKIRSGIFHIPKDFETGAVSLLLHMLQVDPVKRATIKDIVNHEWFKKDLPPYLFPPVHDLGATVIDTDIVNELCENFHCTPEEVTNALSSDDCQHYLVVAYDLILESRRIDSEFEKARFDDFFSYDKKSAKKSTVDKSLHRHPERIDAVSNLTHALEMTDLVDNPSSEILQAPIKKAKWSLGIRSKGRPQDIMSEIFRVMKTLDYEWIVHNAYHITVRKRNDPIQKMILQLYQCGPDYYLLDFKSIGEDSCERDRDSSTHADSPRRGISPHSRTISLPCEIRIGRAAIRSSTTSTENPLSSMSTDSAASSCASSIINVQQQALSSDSHPQLLKTIDEHADDGSGGAHSSQTIKFFEMCSNLIAGLAR